MDTSQLLVMAGLGTLLLSKKGEPVPNSLISEPEDGQVIRFPFFPNVLTVKGNSPNPLRLTWWSGGTLLDNIEVAGVYTASLDVDGPGPHRINFSTRDQNGQPVTGTINLEIGNVITQPPPSPETDLSKYLGVNWKSSLLGSFGTDLSNVSEITRRMSRLKRDKHNFIRLPFYLGIFENNRDRCVQEIDNILTAADNAKDMYVQLTLHHHGVKPGSDDFPSSWTSQYSGSTIYKFWQDFIRNKVPGVDAWAAIWNAWKYILDRVKHHPSLVGVELMNEPKFPPVDSTKGLGSSQDIHAAWGNFYTYQASRIRSMYGDTRYILICEGNMTKDSDEGKNGIAQSSNADTFSLLFPKDTAKIAYGWHRYRLVDKNDPTYTPKASILQKEIDELNVLTGGLAPRGVDFIGDMCQEWAIGKPSGFPYGSPNTLESMKIFLQVFSDNNKGFSYWAAFAEGLGDGRVFYIRDASDPSGWTPNHTRDKVILTSSVTIQASNIVGPGVFFFQARNEVYGY